jgi:hypothetical protein
LRGPKAERPKTKTLRLALNELSDVSWLRELGPTVVACATSLAGIYGMTHGWPRKWNAFLLFFAGLLLVLSLAWRGVAHMKRSVERR